MSQNYSVSGQFKLHVIFFVCSEKANVISHYTLISSLFSYILLLKSYRPFSQRPEVLHCSVNVTYINAFLWQKICGNVSRIFHQLHNSAFPSPNLQPTSSTKDKLSNMKNLSTTTKGRKMKM
ncbi:hypothetical protein NL108_010927 [Boleophthalmus pectinirostris]|nr:hypothetical protein NL108_010927 [Boleophthalmus pectinirostris]